MTNASRSPLFIVHVPSKINSIGITKDALLINALSNKLSVCADDLGSEDKCYDSVKMFRFGLKFI